jgi:hypothetical protein
MEGGDSIFTRPRKQLQPKGASSLVSPRCIFDNAGSSAVKAQDELAALGLDVLLAGERLRHLGETRQRKIQLTLAGLLMEGQCAY